MDIKKYRKINYTSRDFNSLLKDFNEYIKLYFPDSYGDFSPTDPGMMMMELIAYVGDVLSYYQDMQYNEIFQPTELKNAIKSLKLVGGKYKGKTQSNLEATLYLIVPAVVSGGEVQIDTDYLPIIYKGMIASTNDNKQFISTENVDFRDEHDREYAIYATNGNGTPTHFVVRKKIKMVSGQLNTYRYSVSNAESFLKIKLPSDHNVLEIISVKDSTNDDWYEVEYLSQDEIFISELNQSVSKYDVPYLLSKKKVPKRFIVDVDHNGVTSLVFGSSNGNLESGIIYPNPARFLVNSLSDNLGFFSFNNFLLLKSGTMGLSPSNTTLSIQYLYGGGSDYNIPSKVLNNILTRKMIFQKPTSLLDSTKYNDVVNSLQIINNEPSRDGIDGLTVDEIKQIIPIFYNSQKRAVTLEDYVAIIYSLPSKFGGIYSVISAKDANDERSVALYIMTLDKNKNFATPSNDLKNNIKIFLSKFKILTNNINIYNGEIINYKLNYYITVKNGYNIYEVKERVDAKLKENLIDTKSNFGESIYLSKIINLIDDVEGVLSVTNLSLTNMIGGNYSNLAFNFKANGINNIITPAFNQIFELKYITDIVGTVTEL